MVSLSVKIKRLTSGLIIAAWTIAALSACGGGGGSTATGAVEGVSMPSSVSVVSANNAE